MQLSEIRAYVKDLAEQDLSITDTQVDRWVNTAIDRINTALESDIPKIPTGAATTYEPDFDPRYHEALVLFANAKYRESDADFNSASYFMNTFNDMLMDMQRDMVIPPAYRKDKNVQQIVVTTDGVMTYNLSMPSGAYYGLVTVYKWNVEVPTNNYTLNSVTRTITFKGIELWQLDKITIVFDNDSALNQPPHAWWNQW